jgi:predicted DNA-binding transcriptional regulator AlpA
MHPHPHEYSELRKMSLAPDDEVLLTARQVCAKLGAISLMSLHRWLGSDAVRFPQPTLRVNNRRYWSAGSIRHWLAERSSKELVA